ncbi:MAG TPA: Rne/Rng family ribonuclease [Methylomirabilota bacterium]|nr:Rne/Rng family ribonuclease [Methylomirabilota bacterium]
MTKRMLIEATHPEETRVVVVDGKRLEEFDYESANKRQLKGNIYLAKVTRVEPSLQAAFVDYGGNRHGFLAFSEIHPDYYRIPVADREALLAEHAAMAAEDAASDAEEDLAANVRADLTTAADKDSDGDPASGENGDDESAAAENEGDALPLLSPPDRLAGPLLDDQGAAAAENGGPAPEADGDAASEEDDPPYTPLTAEADAGNDAPMDAASAVEPDAAPVAEVAEARAPAAPVETVGGDEAEEVRRRRSRPQRRYKIQEVIKRRQIMLVQVTKEERGNKGAALTTYLSLAGRYCVLMPNTGRGGGISRKITSAPDRKRLKSILEEFDIPDGMAVIVRTAGSERNKTELRRDYEYLIRLWDEIRELTLQSTAPTLIYEEASLIKRAIRDLYARDIDEVLVEGEEAYKAAKNFMRTLMPSHAKRVQLYKDPESHLLHRFQVENQLDAIHNPVVQLRSGGYIVINATEALVAIDVNSGRATRERNIEETALKTNVEAAEEIARQLRLRDLAGLIVIDFIDMEENRNNATVERRLKEAMRHDRARIQVGRISAFGLLELSRQRLRPSLIEASTEVCRYCRGSGHVRSTESTALHVLRAIEEEGSRSRSMALTASMPTAVALYVLNNKRTALAEIEQRYGMRILIAADEGLIPPEYRMDRVKTQLPVPEARQPISQPDVAAEEDEDVAEAEVAEVAAPAEVADDDAGNRRRPRRRRRRREDGRPAEEEPAPRHQQHAASVDDTAADDAEDAAADRGEAGRDWQQGADAQDADGQRRRRRRGRRGGRRRRRGGDRPDSASYESADLPETAPVGEPDSARLTGDESPAAYATRAEDAPPAVGDRDETQNAANDGGHELEDDRNTHSPPADVPLAPESWSVGAEVSATSRAHNGDLAPPQSPAPERAAEGDVMPTVAPPPPTEERPAGPPRRGWWKRLIE